MRMLLSLWSDREIVEAGSNVPIIEAEVIVARAHERLGIGVGEHLEVINEPANRSSVVAHDLEVIRAARLDSSCAKIVAALVDADLGPSLGVLVDAGKHVEGVLPASEDRQIAGCVIVALGFRRALPVPPQLGFDIAILARARGVELDPSIRRKPSSEPYGMVARMLDAEPPALEPPRRGSRRPIGAELRPVEAIGEGPAERRIDAAR